MILWLSALKNRMVTAQLPKEHFRLVRLMVYQIIAGYDKNDVAFTLHKYLSD